MGEQYSYLYLLFLYHFNYSRDYYECHDVLEELWFETQRDTFYQGLLQVAVGLYHFRWNNPTGAKLLMEGAVNKLQAYPKKMRGIDVDKIRRETEEYLHKLNSLEEEPFEFYDLTIDILDPELEAMVDAVHKSVEESR